jgi:hypothetical protein
VESATGAPLKSQQVELQAKLASRYGCYGSSVCVTCRAVVKAKVRVEPQMLIASWVEDP